MGPLAEVFGVDEAWLAIGKMPDMTPREQKARNAEVDGVVNVIAGLVRMDGGRPAFPEDPNELADLFAIIRGGHYSLKICLGDEKGDGEVFFNIPRDPLHTVVLGVVRNGSSFDIYEITREAYQTLQPSDRKGSFSVIRFEDDPVLFSPISGFTDRI